jgi:hypothetical protein
MVPLYSGQYKIIIYQGTCIDSSGCHEVVGSVGINEPLSPHLIIHPVPVQSGDDIVIKVINENAIQSAAISTAEGKLSDINYVITDKGLRFNTGNLNPGFYHIVLTSVNGIIMAGKFIVLE